MTAEIDEILDAKGVGKLRPPKLQTFNTTEISGSGGGGTFTMGSINITLEDFVPDTLPKEIFPRNSQKVLDELKDEFTNMGLGQGRVFQNFTMDSHINNEDVRRRALGAVGNILGRYYLSVDGIKCEPAPRSKYPSPYDFVCPEVTRMPDSELPLGAIYIQKDYGDHFPIKPEDFEKLKQAYIVAFVTMPVTRVVADGLSTADDVKMQMNDTDVFVSASVGYEFVHNLDMGKYKKKEYKFRNTDKSLGQNKVQMYAIDKEDITNVLPIKNPKHLILLDYYTTGPCNLEVAPK